MPFAGSPEDGGWTSEELKVRNESRKILLELFVCGDNLRKGAALNTAQIAELVAAEPTEG